METGDLYKHVLCNTEDQKYERHIPPPLPPPPIPQTPHPCIIAMMSIGLIKTTRFILNNNGLDMHYPRSEEGSQFIQKTLWHMPCHVYHNYVQN